MTQQDKIDYSKDCIATTESLILESDPKTDAYWELIGLRRDFIRELFTLHGYARHTGNGDVLRISSLPDNLHILFDGHTVAQPIGWYEPATKEEYYNYIAPTVKYMKHKESWHVLKVDKVLKNTFGDYRKVLFVDHDNEHPIEWYTPATQTEYEAYQNSKQP